MELILTSRRKKVKRRIERDLYWYDSSTKKMLTGKGSELQFDYDPVSKKVIPKFVDREEEIEDSDYPEIKKWLQENRNKYDIAVESDNGKNIVLSISPLQFEDIREDLYRHHIVSDYDSNELEREKRRW